MATNRLRITNISKRTQRFAYADGSSLYLEPGHQSVISTVNLTEFPARNNIRIAGYNSKQQYQLLFDLGFVDYDSDIARKAGVTAALRITGTVPPLAEIGIPYTYVPTVQYGSGTKTFQLLGTLPLGLNFDPNTGGISGTPSAIASKSVIGIVVTDSSGSARLTNQPITVIDDVAPAILNAISYNTPENALWSIVLSSNEVVTWTKTGGADASWFNLSGNVLSLNSKDYETPLDSTGSNVYKVEITATDAAKNKTAQVFTVTISNIDDTAPVITSSANYTVPENQAFTATLTANESVTWSTLAGDDAARFTLSGNTLSLAGQDYENPFDANADNIYLVRVQATDAAGNSSVQAISVNISNVLEGALPTITATAGSINSTAGDNTIILNLPTLVEGEIRSYIPSTGPQFPINSAGSLIRGTVNWNSNGTATGKIRQTRGGVNTDTEVTITLSVPATITLQALSLSLTDIVVGKSVDIDVTGRTSGSSITVTNLPPGLTYNNSTGKITGTATAV